MNPVLDIRHRALNRHATDLDAFAGHADLGEVVEDRAGGAANLERVLRAERGHDLGHGLLVEPEREVPDALVLVVAVVEDHPFHPVEVGRVVGVECQEVGPAPER